jgi:peptidoglycan/LPS O-acetylase OafA/YrhL
MSGISYRPDIDALRGLAVFLVVIFHTFPEIIPGGFIGVDVFFVISGYLITSIILTSIEKGNFSIKEFYSKRVKRLFPALIVVLLTTLLVGWLVLFPDEFKQLGDHIAHSAIYILNYILIGEVGYFDVDAQYKPLIHLWTLSIEEQYYIFWPLLLLLAVKQKIIKLSYLVLLILILSFAANVYYINDYPESVYFNTLTRAWQLAAGSMLAVVLFEKAITENRKIAVTGFILIVSSALLVTEDSIYPGWLAIFPSVGAMFIILGNVRLPLWGGMLKLGLISYPLYLWHWVVISFLTIYTGGTLDLIAMTGAVTLSLLLAWATYKYIEPIRYSEHKLTAKGLFIILMIVGLIGLYVKDQDGMENRNHLNYLDKFNIEFTRTPAADKLCDQFVKSKIEGDRQFYYCRADNIESKRYIAIIGDSHAHVMYPGISKIAQQHGYGVILLANSGCPPLIGFKRGRNKKEIDHCQKKISQIFNVINNIGTKIDKVFFATRGPVNIHGEVEGKHTDRSVSESLSKAINNIQTYKAYQKGLRKSFEELNKKTSIKNIYYFLENPELDFLPKEIIPRPFDVWDLSASGRTMTKELYLKRMSSYRSTIAQAVKGLDVTVIDPINYMCDQDRCYSYKNNNFLYSDYHHLSVFGSKYLAEKMKDILFENKND